MSNITNLNRDYLIKINVKEATIDVPKMTFWNTDKKTSNMFVQLVINMSENELIKNYVTIENATDYKIVLNVIKPKTNQYRTFEAKLLNEEKALFEIDLPDEYKDQVGNYNFEFEVSSKVDGNDESITTSNATYEVKGSLLTNLNEETSSSPDLPILKQLIEQVKSLQGGDLTGYQKKSDNSLETTSKEVVGAINEVNSQYKDIAKQTITTDERTKLNSLENYDDSSIKNDIQTQKSRIDSFTSLKEGSTTGDAELIDARIGDDYNVYNNIGDAIRSQFKNIKKDLYEVSNTDSIISADTYVKKANMIISGTNEVNGKFTKALLESQVGEHLGVTIVEVNAGEVYKISGDTMPAKYNALGLIFSDTKWEDSFTSSKRINILGDIDYYCGKTVSAWQHFTDYEVVVPAGAKYMYIRGSETVKKAGQHLESKIPTKISNLKNDNNCFGSK